MRQHMGNFLRQHGIKILISLLVWSLVLLFILKVYNTENTYVDHDNVIKRQNKIATFLRDNSVLGSFWRNAIGGDDDDELVLKLGETKVLSDEELFAAIEEEQPALPFSYWYLNEDKSLRKSSKCATFPSLFNVRYHNKYWQTFQTANITAQLYGAYYDMRLTQPTGPLVHVLAMINTTEEKHIPPTHCQLWYDEQRTPVFAKVIKFRMIWYKAWGNKHDHLYPYLISCQPPKELSKKNSTLRVVPRVVSLVANECDTASNALRVSFEQAPAPTDPNGAPFAVCVKGLDYPYTDISVRLIEWIELQHILGASQIYFYHLQVHPNVTKVLEHYKRSGLVHVRPTTLAGGESSTPHLQHYLLQNQLLKKRLNELIPYNDCLYRNLYKYEHIALQDIDEVLMPVGNRTHWSDIVAMGARNRTASCKQGYASYCLQNVYYPSHNNSVLYSAQVPQYMYMLQHVLRNSSHMRPNYATKCLHRTQHVQTLHNHFPLSWLETCGPLTLPPEVAQLQHYRDIKDEQPIEQNVVDPQVWRFKDELLRRTTETMRELGFIRGTGS